ncbi:MAG: DUF3408 domain-containing protein [Muribaculaceae bacterium]|nr:DUF3408 domain-containing protein [Muribaculaceae bacterium]
MATKPVLKETQPTEKADNIFNQNVEDRIISQGEKSTVESTASASLPSTAEPKQQRVGIRQRRLDFEEYKATYLSSKTLTDRKQTNISRELYDRIALMVRRLGDIDTTVSGFIDSVLRQHMEDYASDHEVWRKL